MSREFVKKRKPKEGQELPREGLTEKQVRRQLAWATNSEQFKSRDPMFHITDNFMRSFDTMAGLKVKELLGAMKEEVPGMETPQEEGKRKTAGAVQTGDGQAMEEKTAFTGGGDEQFRELLERSRQAGDYGFSGINDVSRIGKFSEMGFMRGKISASVLAGTGQMMLFSCLKRTLGQSEPYKLQQRRLLLSSARSWKPDAGAAADDSRVLYSRNQTFEESAVALTFDVTRNARRNVDLMTELIRHGTAGTETWEKMAPFLNMDKEEHLLKNYRAQLEALGTDAASEEQRKILDRAVTKTETLLAKKKQLRNEFIFKLRAIGDQAREAAMLFSELVRKPEKVREALRETYPAPPEGDPPPADEMPSEGSLFRGGELPPTETPASTDRVQPAGTETEGEQ